MFFAPSVCLPEPPALLASFLIISLAACFVKKFFRMMRFFPKSSPAFTHCSFRFPDRFPATACLYYQFSAALSRVILMFFNFLRPMITLHMPGRVFAAFINYPLPDTSYCLSFLSLFPLLRHPVSKRKAHAVPSRRQNLLLSVLSDQA